MNISKNTGLIEASLMKDLPDCSDVEPSDVELSHEENILEDKLPSITNFNKNFEVALEEYILSQSGPNTKHDADESSVEIYQDVSVYSITNTVPDSLQPDETVTSVHEQSKKKLLSLIVDGRNMM